VYVKHNVEKMKQQLVDVWQSSNAEFNRKMRFQCFCALSGGAKVLLMRVSKINSF